MCLVSESHKNGSICFFCGGGHTTTGQAGAEFVSISDNLKQDEGRNHRFLGKNNVAVDVAGNSVVSVRRVIGRPHLHATPEQVATSYRENGTSSVQCSDPMGSLLLRSFLCRTQPKVANDLEPPKSPDFTTNIFSFSAFSLTRTHLELETVKSRRDQWCAPIIVSPQTAALSCTASSLARILANWPWGKTESPNTYTFFIPEAQVTFPWPKE